MRERAHSIRIPRPELIGLLALAGVLNLWALSRNGWANYYYSAAVRSMSSSWHNFLFASLDRSGVMTVDKPPLALWVESLSVRVFGYHPLSILVPQALMGVATVALVYDLVRRRFGRVGGFIGGLALALTPVTVAISRHNNPDALLVLCCVASLWCAVRAFERGSTRWLIAAGVCVGLGFETKMGVALVAVPAIAVAWLWVDPAARGRLRALSQLLAGGGMMLLVAGAWPALVELTPAADRPWISGTPNNSILSLIFEYNGLGRVEGQAGGPGGGGTMFGGTAGPLRLLNSALGGQAGWLLGFAVLSGVAILASSRLRRRDPRTAWLIAVGGAFLTTAVLFSFAGGIFHPYYVSLLAPFAAALVGAGAAQLIDGKVNVRIFGPAAVLAGVIVELAVHNDYPGNLTWLTPVLIIAGVICAGALLIAADRRVRAGAVAGAVAALLIAPAVWAVDTLGHATSGTFPAGGPSSVASAGGPGGGAGPGGGFPGAGGGAQGGPGQLFGGASANGGGAPGGAPGLPAAGGEAGAGAGGQPGLQGAAGGAGGQFGGASLTKVISYTGEHGGGTIAVSSQSSAATAITDRDANVAGIGGFSGRESDVSVSWLAGEVAAGKIRWVLDEESASASSPVAGTGLGTGFGGAEGRGFGTGLGGIGGLPGDTRTGAKIAIAAAGKACVKATTSTGAGTLYDCRGRASELAAAGA